MQIKFIPPPASNPPSLLRKIGIVIGALAVVGLALMFSALLLPFLLIGGLYLWWRTRKVRQQFRDMQAQMEQMQSYARQSANPQSQAFQGEVFEGEIIEGEAVRVDERRPF